MTRESQHTEWKEAWRDDHLRWVCGFANAEGGRLEIGRNDAGAVVGLADAQKLLEDLPNKIRDLLGILVSVNLRQSDGKDLLEIVVDPYPNPISYRGHYYVRSGSTLQEIKGAALDRFLLRRHGRTWDGVPVPGVSAADLSTAELRRFRDLASGGGRLETADLAVADAALVAKLNLVEGDYLKRAAVLLFHDDPERWITGAFVKIGFFRSESDLVYHDTIHGNLFEQVAKTVDLLRTKYLKAAIRYSGLQRIERFPVPAAALREAVLNALVHRDYATAAPVQIRVYPDRLNLWNPAVLPEGWTVETLLGEHPSAPHNPVVAGAFFRRGDIETWGRGIRRIFEACRAAGEPEPRLRSLASDLWLEFPFASDYLRDLSAAGQVAGEVTGGVAGEVTPEVTPEVRRMLSVVVGEMNRTEIMLALGLRDEKHFREHYQQTGIAAGVLEMTIPGKPKSRLQKYRLTAAGKRLASRPDTP